MNKRSVILVLLALGILCLGVYLLQQSFANPVDDTWRSETQTVEDPGTAKATGEVKEGKADAEPDKRVAVAAEADSSTSSETGTLVVRVLWPDGGPAADTGVDVIVTAPVRQRFSDSRGWLLTDEKGEVRLEDLAAGKCWVRSYRKGMGWDRANVVADTVSEMVIKLTGVDVHGRVVDGSGEAVANAGIWLTTGNTGWLGGRVITHSDAKGEFQIRAVSEGQSLGALARGFAPSDLVDLDDVDTSKVPVSVRLTLAAPGGTVAGTVTSPTGEAVPGADVCVGKKPRYFRPRHNMSARETWTPLTASTDAAGRFELPWVAPGKHPVGIRSRGLPIWRGEVVVKAGEVSRLDVKLQAGVVVHGVVTELGGKPVANAVVRAYDKALDERYVQTGQFDYEGVFGFPLTAADAKGRYRLTGVAPGSIHLYATRSRQGQMGEALVRAKAVLKGEAGEVLEWNPVLNPGHTIAGLVTFRDGVPMKYVFVTAWHEKTNKYQALTTNKEGRFRFTNLDLAYYKLTVQYPFRGVPKGAPPLVKKKVWPDTGEVLLAAVFDSPGERVPASVCGRVHDAAGRHERHGLLGVRLSYRRGWRNEKVKEDGTFEFKTADPGRYRVLVTSGEKVIYASDEFDLTAAQRHDVGTLVTEPGGSLRLKLVREKGTEKIKPRLWLKHLEDSHSYEIQPKLATEHVEKNLCVGRYEVILYGQGVAEARVRVEVRVGQESVVEIRIRPAVPRKLEFVLPEKGGPKKLELVIHDAKGVLFWKGSVTPSARLPNPYRRTIRFPVGRYTLKVSTPSGFSCKREIEVRDLKAEAPAIRIEVPAR